MDLKYNLVVHLSYIERGSSVFDTDKFLLNKKT